MLAACGGGGGDGGIGESAAIRAAPAAPTPPVCSRLARISRRSAPRRAPAPAIAPDSAFTEKMFLRSWTNELYLWYTEVPDQSDRLANEIQYFDLLKTHADDCRRAAQGSLPFHVRHRRLDRAVAVGQSIGYGAQW